MWTHRQRVDVLFSREKLNACRRAHHPDARTNYIITKFPSNTSQSKSISLRDERNLIPLRGDSVERGVRKNEKRKQKFHYRETAGFCEHSGVTKIEFRCRKPFYTCNKLAFLKTKLLIR